MKKRNGFYPRVRVDAAGVGRGVAGRCGRAGRDGPDGRSGPRRLDRAWRRGASRWRCTTRRKVMLDLAITLAVGGDCLADIAVLRAEPGVFGLVASDPTVSRTISGAGRRRRPGVDRDRHRPGGGPGDGRGRWPGSNAPDHGTDADRPLVIDLDATLVTAHSDKEGAAPTFKRGYGYHPLWAFVDHGPEGTGEPLRSCCARERRLEHRRRPHHRHPGRARPAARSTGPGPGRVAGSWSAPTPPAAPTRSWTG